ncbi:MAG: hypothetical protein Q7R22_001160 [Verrucomicrobiota bacterium JB025]|nr:hypothetical protein [Verrucomicrobiota bacterium JB025]
MSHSRTDHTPHADFILRLGMVLATALIFVCAIILIGFAILREDQLFWTNAGGYPLLLRDTVRVTFLPLLAFCVLGLFALSLACLAGASKASCFTALEAVFIIVCWGLLTTTGFIAFRNNASNIIGGKCPATIKAGR